MRKSAGFFNRLLQQFLDVGRSGSQLRQTLSFEINLQRRRSATHTGQILAEPIVQVAADSLLLVFADFDNLLFEFARVLEQGDTRDGGMVAFSHRNSGQSNEEEKSKADGHLPRLNSRRGVGMTQDNVSPGPKDAGQTRDSKSTLVVAQPNREHDRHAVKQNQRHLVAGDEVDPDDDGE